MLPTPFTADLEIDSTRLGEFIGRLADARCDAIVLTGGLAEISALNDREIAGIWRLAVDETPDGIQLIAGIQGDEARATQLASAAADAGVATVLLFPDFARADDEQALNYLRSVVSKTGISAYVDHGATRWTDEVLERAQAEGLLQGVKFSSPDLRVWNQLRTRPNLDLHWLCGAGDDLAPAFHLYGAHGFTSSLVNVAPNVVGRLAQLLESRRFLEAGAITSQIVQPLARIRRLEPGYDVTVIKTAMELLGYGKAFCRAWPPLNPGVRSQVESAVQILEVGLDLGVAIDREVSR